ncbi:MAG: hypothetical protein NTW74_11260, partial [Acidobacteria bacterium]|nr:hypothetical protein [Acidobacteriota bacterium]
MKWKQDITKSSLATLAGLVVHFALSYAMGFAVLTDVIAEWIMARTPSAWAVPLLEVMGTWAKPFAATGGLATLGFVMWLPLLLGSSWLAVLFIGGLCWALDYSNVAGVLSFLIPGVAVLLWKPVEEMSARREFLTSVAMSSGTVLVAVEAWWRNERMASKAIEPVPLFRWTVPAERVEWGKGLVRKPVTSVREFYVMSKNTVDPVVDPKTWRLKISVDDRLVREFSYAELLSLPRQ